MAYERGRREGSWDHAANTGETRGWPGKRTRTQSLPARREQLPSDIKTGIEQLSGIAMNDVHVVHQSAEPESVGALAYARGNEIHLGPGQEQHLPHEAWHVVQQKQGRVAATAQLKGGDSSNADPALEAEADEMGARAAAVGRSAPEGRLGEPRAATSGTAVTQRIVKDFKGEQDKRIEVLLPNGKPIHLEVDSMDTVEDLKKFLAPRLGCPPGAIRIYERVGIDELLSDDELLVPFLLYKAVVKKVGPKLKEEGNVAKVDVAKKIQEAIIGTGYTVMLGGGGAVALLGSGRDIKDLDFKMGQKLKEAYKAEPEKVTEKLLTALESVDLRVEIDRQNPYVLRLRVLDLDLDLEHEPIEVSFTTTGNYDKSLSLPSEETEGVGLISEMELFLDKLFAFCERSPSDLEKLATDFIDIVTLIDLNPSLESPRYLEERLAGYLKKFRRELGSSKLVNAYLRLAPDVGLQVAMRTTLVINDSKLREMLGLRTLRIAAVRVGKVAKALQELAKHVH